MFFIEGEDKFIIKSLFLIDDLKKHLKFIYLCKTLIISYLMSGVNDVVGSNDLD